LTVSINYIINEKLTIQSRGKRSESKKNFVADFQCHEAEECGADNVGLCNPS